MHSDVSRPTGTPLRQLGERLKHLYQWANARHYDHIWDLCCDHGRLGLHLYTNNSGSHADTAKPDTHIHLVDQVPTITDRLKKHYCNKAHSHLHIHCLDAAKLALTPRQLKQKHLFVIAGVGGETAAKIAAGLLAHNAPLFARANPSIEFIFSPNNQAFELRRFLQERHFHVIAEAFISEKGWHHEHIHVELCPAESHGASALIDAIGDDIWAPMTPQKRQYLTKQQNHYARCARYKGCESDIMAAEGYKHALCSSIGGDSA